MIGSAARKAVKAMALPVGALALRKPGDLSILLYHKIGTGDREIDLPRAALHGHLSWLAQEGRVVSLDRALQGVGGVVITFDDGYADFYEHAFPLLVEHGLPALLYLATGLVENGAEKRTGGEAGLTWSQLAEMVGTGLISIGSHTHNHTDLSRAGQPRAMDEMRRSKELIEDHLEVVCRHFAYPWAVGSPVADRVARGLFDSAALEWGTNRSGRVDRYRLARLPVLRADGQRFFRAKVTGRLDAEAVAYRILRRGPWRKR